VPTPEHSSQWFGASDEFSCGEPGLDVGVNAELAERAPEWWRTDHLGNGFRAGRTAPLASDS